MRAVLFDLDGTLVDSHALIVESFRHAARAVLRRDPSDEEASLRWGEPLPVRFAGLAPDSVPALVDEYSRYYDDHRTAARPFPGVADLLVELRARRLQLAIVTSKRRRPASESLDICGLAWAIEALVSSEDAWPPKPHRAPVDTALQRLRARAADALLVGDGVLDIAAARAAGVRSAGALWGAFDSGALRRSGPDYLVAAPADVATLLHRLSRP